MTLNFIFYLLQLETDSFKDEFLGLNMSVLRLFRATLLRARREREREQSRKMAKQAIWLLVMQVF